jgi:hypothetical protein
MMFRIAPTAICFALILFASTALGAKPNTLSPEELADGWILLFDGETTFGWTAANKANWSVADGAISVSSGEKGLLHTTTQFANYELRVDFRSAKGANSGVFLRTLAVVEDPATDCYELNIADAETNPFPTGSLVGRKKATGGGENDSQDWQTFEVTAEGGRFVVKLDGRAVLDYTDPKPLGRGFIGLQLNSGQVEFRNIKLRPLGTKSIFNGKDLSGWKTDQAQASKFSVIDGAMNVKNGRGQIETEGRYGDFVLQLDVFSNGEALNSGVFFRCIPGDFQMGYESQIQNGTIDGDPTKPADCGTGGIFRRQNARRVVAKDFEWFTKTIIADGPHMAVWVNGIQVSDWTDTRKPDENPRRGLRTEPGAIILQGHDPTTDLSFRGFRIVEIPQR